MAASDDKGLSGLGSVNKDTIDKSTLESLRAGLHVDFKISKQIEPWELILG